MGDAVDKLMKRWGAAPRSAPPPPAPPAPPPVRDQMTLTDLITGRRPVESSSPSLRSIPEDAPIIGKGAGVAGGALTAVGVPGAIVRKGALEAANKLGFDIPVGTLRQEAHRSWQDVTVEGLPDVLPSIEDILKKRPDENDDQRRKRQKYWQERVSLGPTAGQALKAAALNPLMLPAALTYALYKRGTRTTLPMRPDETPEEYRKRKRVIETEGTRALRYEQFRNYVNELAKRSVGGVLDMAADPVTWLAGPTARAVKTTVGAGVKGVQVAAKTGKAAVEAGEAATAAQRAAMATTKGGEFVRRTFGPIFSRRAELGSDIADSVMSQTEAREMGQNVTREVTNRLERQIGRVKGEWDNRKVMDALSKSDEAGEQGRLVAALTEPERKVYDIWSKARASVEAKLKKAEAARLSQSGASLLPEDPARLRALRMTEQGVTAAEKDLPALAAATGAKAENVYQQIVGDTIVKARAKAPDVNVELVKERLDRLVLGAERKAGRPLEAPEIAKLDTSKILSRANLTKMSVAGPARMPSAISVTPEGHVKSAEAAVAYYRKVGQKLQSGGELSEKVNAKLQRLKPLLVRGRQTVRESMAAPAYTEFLKKTPEMAFLKSLLSTPRGGGQKIGRTTVGPRRKTPGAIFEANKYLDADFFETDVNIVMKSGITKGLDAYTNAVAARRMLEWGLKEGHIARTKIDDTFRTISGDEYGLWKSEKGGDLYARDDLAQFLENHWITRQPSKSPLAGAGRWISHKLRTTERWFVGSNPASFVRDVVDETVMAAHFTNDVVGARSIGNAIGKHVKGKLKNGMSYDKVDDLSIRYNVVGGLAPSWWGAGAAPTAAQTKMGKFFSKVMYPPNFLPGSGERMREMVSADLRRGLFAKLLEQGDEPAKAAAKVKLALRDYDPRLFSAIEQKWVRHALPFYTFLRRNIPAQAKLFLGAGETGVKGARHTAITLLPLRVKQSFEAGQERDFRYNWESDAQIQVENGLHVDLRNYMSQSDFFEMVNAMLGLRPVEFVAGRVGPIGLKKIVEVGLNTEFYTGKKIDKQIENESFLANFWIDGNGQDEKFLGLPVGKRIDHLLSVFKGLDQLSYLIGRPEEEQDVWARLMRVVGVPRFYPVDQEKIIRAKEAEVKRLMSERRRVGRELLQENEKQRASVLYEEMKKAIYEGNTDRQRALTEKIEALRKVLERRRAANK